MDNGRKYYTIEEVIKKGYTMEVLLNEGGHFNCDGVTFIIDNRNKHKSNLEEFDFLDDIAIKKRGEEGFVFAESIYHRLPRRGSLYNLFIVNYGRGKTEGVWLSQIEKLIANENSYRSSQEDLVQLWKRLSDLNKTF